MFLTSVGFALDLQRRAHWGESQINVQHSKEQTSNKKGFSSKCGLPHYFLLFQEEHRIALALGNFCPFIGTSWFYHIGRVHKPRAKISPTFPWAVDIKMDLSETSILFELVTLLKVLYFMLSKLSQNNFTSQTSL